MVLVKTMLGLGDCFYIRFALRSLPSQALCLITSWPQVYHDFVGTKFVRPKDVAMRTQRANIEKLNIDWIETDKRFDYSPCYQLSNPKRLVDQIASYLHGNIVPLNYDVSFTVKQEWIEAALELTKGAKKPICIIRPNTLRPEWLCPARNPKTEYLQRFIDNYKEEFHFVSIANLKHLCEYYDGELKGVDQEFTTGVPIETVFGLFHIAALAVFSPSFWLTTAYAIGTPSICIYGANVPHRRLEVPNLVHNITAIEPENFHECNVTETNARKDIKLEVLDSTFEKVVKTIL
jgi:ADP-heptose:LPS heptosyltransferase